MYCYISVHPHKDGEHWLTYRIEVKTVVPAPNHMGLHVTVPPTYISHSHLPGIHTIGGEHSSATMATAISVAAIEPAAVIAFIFATLVATPSIDVIAINIFFALLYKIILIRV